MTVIIASPEPAVVALAGRTISVERVGDVPELAKFPALTMAWERVIVERLDGGYVRHHGAEFGDRLTQTGSNIETAARALVVMLASRCETADYRYVVLPEARTEVTAAQILRLAADVLAGVTHARVIPGDVRDALWKAAPDYYQGQAALDALREHGGDARWLSGWTGPRERVHVVATIRAAAEYCETPASVPA